MQESAAVTEHPSPPPFVWVSPSMAQYPVIRAVGRSWPCHILGFTLQDNEPVFTLEQVAQLAVTTITASVPHGPYLLGGWCKSGILALEIAHQLGKAGHHVALLALFDHLHHLCVRPTPRIGRAGPARSHPVYGVESARVTY